MTAKKTRLVLTEDGEARETTLADFLADNVDDAEACEVVAALPAGAFVRVGFGVRVERPASK